ncbi:MAG TPA: hypothetical protein VF164_05665 [Trueperaceae bacterium]
MRPLLTAVATCLLLAAAFPGGLARSQGIGAVPDFPLELVEPGLTGYGLTEGPGGEVGRFDVEVLAVQYEAGPGFPLVLIRASGALMQASGGVAAGMSGSPVYLPRGGGDALLGAIGYVFPEADHDLALVTPIAEMRDRRIAGTSGNVVVPGLGSAVPVTTPVLMAGASDRTAELVEALFAAAPTRPVFSPRSAQGNAGPQPAEEADTLEPGAAIAVQLMSGDLQLAALGTLTAVEGRSLLGFGHALFGAGAISYGLAPARVTAFVPSAVVPFKLANVSATTVGAVTLDTPAAIAGASGVEPRVVQLQLAVTAGNREERFDVRLADDERLYPQLVAIATLEAADRVLRATGPGRAELAWEVTLSGGDRVNVVEQVSSTTDIALDAARLAAGPLAILATNRFAAPEVSQVSLSVNIGRDPGSAEVAKLVLETEDLVAGGHAIVHVRLQPYRREAVVRTFSVPLPDDLTGDVTLLVRGGDVPREIEGAPEEGGEVDEPGTFAELIDALRNQVQGSEIVFESVDEHGDVRRLSRVPLPWVVIGSQDLHVTIRGAGDAEEEAAPGTDAQTRPQEAEGSADEEDE